ncbi:MAG: family 20 glycosylhydrolase [Polaribacter sp.]|jgi:hexosaminidase|uniref:beta-N-acetylhexosaminidase n=1 Tax=Polaribacter sp. TaxID=1920175 RepID=UPI00260FF41A|nr:family 20 glycosylhydrolase [Polaribacter sp.]MDG1194401.1 family 20 glycosylhydrolase [Polaribacter sp.]MDG1402289.1 family 20 glycosylhydrolase [Polaribacter sp.]
MKRVLTIIMLSLFNYYYFYSQSSLIEKYNLMPWPQEINENSASFNIDEQLTIHISGEDAKQRVHNNAVQFLRRLANRTGIFIDAGFPIENKNASININFDAVSKLTTESDESYSLDIKKSKISINAKTDVGALRGLETLLQLVHFNKSNYYFEGVSVNDSPRFVWRGLMIDAARHFQPVDVIKRNLDAMASVKMNVFHWHLTDDQGFRVESKVFPRLQEVAADGLFYTQEQIKDVVKYASNLGIRVVPEFDVPGHASAILAAYPELGSKEDYNYNVERFSGIFNPTLNPSKEVTYLFLETLFREITPLFPDEYFHIGGDENEGKHWDGNEEIQEFKKKHNLKTNHDLQTFFNIKLDKVLKKLDKKLMGWDEILTPSTPTTAVIHSWRGKHEGLKQSTLIKAAKKGYQTVLSAGFYIDRVLSVDNHYNIDPIGNAVLTKDERKRILGAETTMWSELVTPLTIDSRIWPRTAAIAERFWSSKEVNDLDNMKKRLKVINFQLEELGITHIKNRDLILRNIANHKSIDALKTLSNICEPLKVYSRNKGGTEYKTFSPFTLFADACVPDAEDAVVFKKTVTLFLKSKDKNNLHNILTYLKKWSDNDAEFEKINQNPITNSLASLSKNVSQISKLLFDAFQNKKYTNEDLKNANTLLKKLKEPCQDIELVVVEPLNQLNAFCKNNYTN